MDRFLGAIVRPPESCEFGPHGGFGTLRTCVQNGQFGDPNRQIQGVHNSTPGSSTPWTGRIQKDASTGTTEPIPAPISSAGHVGRTTWSPGSTEVTKRTATPTQTSGTLTQSSQVQPERVGGLAAFLRSSATGVWVHSLYIPPSPGPRDVQDPRFHRRVPKYGWICQMADQVFVRLPASTTSLSNPRGQVGQCLLRHSGRYSTRARMISGSIGCQSLQ